MDTRSFLHSVLFGQTNLQRLMSSKNLYRLTVRKNITEQNPCEHAREWISKGKRHY